jgi:DNA repair protein RadA/Sms
VALGNIASTYHGQRQPTGYSEVDRVLGGGFVPGSVTLVSGEPGVGKSTLLLALTERLHAPALYASGEESAEQVSGRLKRLGLSGAKLSFTNETNVAALGATVRELKPALVVVDSLQAVSMPDEEAALGSPTQVRAALSELVGLAKSTGVPVVVVGHVTKAGVAAGPKAIEHLVDVVLTLEGAEHQPLRFLRASKNRFGATDEVGVFEMGERGLVEVANPSALFLCERHQGAGSCITALLEGSRSLLCEVQALVTHSRAGYPKRATTGFDGSRLEVLLAVLGERAGVKLNYSDVYINLAGGFRSREPALDLAVCVAIASAATKRPLPKDLVVFGEVGLGGEVRPVVAAERRLQEAARLGFVQALVPPLTNTERLPSDLALVPVKTVAEAVQWIR